MLVRILVDEYPVLTLEMLAAVERKVEAMKTEVDDCYFIDHYLTAIGKPGVVLDIFKEEGFDSFHDIEEALEEDPDDFDDLTSASITGSLLGCVRALQQRVRQGEKIH